MEAYYTTYIRFLDKIFQILRMTRSIQMQGMKMFILILQKKVKRQEGMLLILDIPYRNSMKNFQESMNSETG